MPPLQEPIDTPFDSTRLTTHQSRPRRFIFLLGPIVRSGASYQVRAPELREDRLRQQIGHKAKLQREIAISFISLRPRDYRQQDRQKLAS